MALNDMDKENVIKELLQRLEDQKTKHRNEIDSQEKRIAELIDDGHYRTEIYEKLRSEYNELAKKHDQPLIK